MSYADLSPPYIWYLCVCTHICLAFGNEFIVTELLFAMHLFLSIAACLPPKGPASRRALQTEILVPVFKILRRAAWFSL